MKIQIQNGKHLKHWRELGIRMVIDDRFSNFKKEYWLELNLYWWYLTIIIR